MTGRVTLDDIFPVWWNEFVDANTDLLDLGCPEDARIAGLLFFLTGFGGGFPEIRDGAVDAGNLTRACGLSDWPGKPYIPLKELEDAIRSISVDDLPAEKQRQVLLMQLGPDHVLRFVSQSLALERDMAAEFKRAMG